MSNSKNVDFDCIASLDNRFMAKAMNSNLVFSIGEIRSTSVVNGRLYADVNDFDNGAFHSRCPVMCFGGGIDRVMFVPLEPTDFEQNSKYLNECILVHRKGGKPYVIGTKQPIGLGIVPVSPEDPGAKDHVGDVGKLDFAITNNGCKLIVDSNGAFTVITGNANYARFQLADEGGRFRISRGGEANESVILGDIFIDTWINQLLYGHLVTLNNRIAALEAHIAMLSSILSTGLDVVGTVTGGTTVAGTTVPPSGLSAFIAIPGTAVPQAGDQYKSSTIQLSAKSKAE